MGYKKPIDTTRSYLENAPLPNHGKSYTVISHKTVIDNTLNLLENSGFTVTEQLYTCNMNANVARGIYYIIPNSTDDAVNSESELGMMFTWTNSYDKSTSFQCGIGGYVFVCNNGMIHGDMATFARKHTGSADVEVQRQISSQIKYAHKHFNQLIQDKEEFKKTKLSVKQQAELLGRLFIEEKILDATQLSSVKREIDKPSFDYKTNPDNGWAFYNHVTNSLKLSHPRSWMTNQQKFHKFMTSELLSNVNIKTYDSGSLKSYIPSNGVYNGNVSEMVADLEAQDFDTFGDFKI